MSFAAVVIFIGVFAIRPDGMNQTILVLTVVTLVIVALVHAQFIFRARAQTFQTGKRLRKKEREFQSVFENALDSILVLDCDGVCQNANPSAETLFSVRQGNLIGQSVRPFFADTTNFDSIWSQLQDDREYQGEIDLVRSDGAKVFAEFTATPNFLPNRHLMILRDVSDRRRAQQAVNQSLMIARSSWQEAETLRRASMALTEDLRMNSILDALLQALADFVPYERAQLFLLEDGTRFFLAHESALLSKPTPGSGFPDVLDIADFPVLRKVVASPDGVRIDDVTKELTWSPLGREGLIRSWIGVPIISANRVLGLLSLSASRPGHFSANHLALSRSLATPAAVAIQNARLYERAEIYGAELERRVSELHQIDQGLRERRNESRGSLDRFEKVFRSAPVGISVSSLVSGRLLEVNETFERSFGLTQGEIASGEVTELKLWADPRERMKLIERLGRGEVVCNAVAQFRRISGSYRDVMYSARMIELEGEPCVLFVAEDQIT